MTRRRVPSRKARNVALVTMAVLAVASGLLLGPVDPADAAFSNQGFESGIPPWEGSGAFGTVGNLGPILPPEGSLMALIQTGSGALAPPRSFLQQNFGVALEAPVYMLADFLTNETTPSSQFNDTFSVTASVGGNPVVLLLLNTSSTFFSVSGTGFSERTGFIPFTVPVGTDFLVFQVFNVGGSSGNSAALIDVSPTAVPEPASLGLMGALFLGLAGAAWRLKRIR